MRGGDWIKIWCPLISMKAAQWHIFPTIQILTVSFSIIGMFLLLLKELIYMHLINERRHILHVVLFFYSSSSFEVVAPEFIQCFIALANTSVVFELAPLRKVCIPCLRVC